MLQNPTKYASYVSPIKPQMFNIFDKSRRNLLILISFALLSFLGWYFYVPYRKAKQVESLLKNRQNFEGLLVAIEATAESLERYQNVIEPVQQSLQKAVAVARERQEFQTSVTTFTFSPDGKYFLTGYSNGRIQFWKPDGTPIGKSIQTYGTSTELGGIGRVATITFDSKSQQMLVSDYAGKMQIWDIKGRPLSKLWSGLAGAVLSPDGKTVVATGENGKVGVWDSQGNVLRSPKQAHWFPVTDIAFHPDGQMFVTGDAKGRIRRWTRTGQALNKLEKEGTNDNFTRLVFQPDGKSFLMFDRLSNSLLEYNLQEGWENRITKFSIPSEIWSFSLVWSADFNPNSEYLALSYENSMLQLWSTDGRTIGQAIKEQGLISTVKISPDGRYAAGEVQGEDYGTKLKLWEFPRETQVSNDWSTLLNQACERIKSHSKLLEPTTQTKKVVKICKTYAKE